MRKSPPKGLFAVAVEKRVRYGRTLGWIPGGIIYVHGTDTANARFEYLKTDMQRRTRIVACGPVIGYFAENADASIVSV